MMLPEGCVVSAAYALEDAMPRFGAVDDLPRLFAVVRLERNAPVWLDIQHMLDEYAAHVFVEFGEDACNDVYNGLEFEFEGRL